MPPDDNSSYEARLMRVVAYIHDNLDGDLSLDTLADIACLSRFHWHRVFRAMTGETLADAIRRLRLTRAANALLVDETPIATIAERHGYPNLASFSRAFSATHGIAPAEFRARGQRLTALIRNNTGALGMYPVSIESFPALRAAGVAHRGAYNQVSTAFQTLGAVVAARNLFVHARGMVALFHDDPSSVPEPELRAHAALILSDTAPSSIEGLDMLEIAGGKYAVLQHQGPYATLQQAWEWLYGVWLPQSGAAPADGPPMEVYLNDPRSTPADQLRTDIRLPLK